MNFWDLFAGYTKAHGLYTPEGKQSNGKVKGKAVTVSAAPLLQPDWERHLRGEAPGLGIVPLRDDDETVLWGAIDIDDRNVDHRLIETKCEEAHLPVVISRSKSGGAHVWLFCDGPINAQLVQLKLTEWAAYLGYGGCEVFPKQTTRANGKDTGNWINMPYFGNDRRAVRGGVELELDDFLSYAEAQRCTQQRLMQIDVKPTGEEFSDGPPCLQHIHAAGGFIDGTRNNGYFNVAVYLRIKHEDDWPSKMLDYNSRQADPLPVTEVQGLITNVGKKGYHYTCQQPPICNHCNKQVCMTREYGLTAGPEEMDLDIRGLTKYDSRPPVWVLDVEGIRIQLKDTEQFMSQPKFQRLCVEEINKFPTPVGAKTWTKVVQGLLERVEVLPVPEDAGPEGQFFEYLQEFIRNHKAPEREDLATGNVWIDGEWACFRSNAFFDYLKRHGFRDFTVPYMYALLRDKLGLEKLQMNVKGRVFNYWKIKAPSQQDQPFDTPSFQENY